jgi:hypothetical protein
MSTTEVSDRFTALHDERTLAETVLALEEHGFRRRGRRRPAPRDTVLARIPEGSFVTINMSVTLQEIEIADAIDRRATSSAALTDWEPMIAAGAGATMSCDPLGMPGMTVAPPRRDGATAGSLRA